jgi:alkylation response protein AidB-like acyl-CoA dehydrogenase
MNGTVEGEDVWIPMTSILGGQERCGFGWNMFVECLAEGRGVSLPAGSIGAAKSVVAGVGAYARVRKQFRVPIAEFGGIQEGESQTIDYAFRCSHHSVLNIFFSKPFTHSFGSGWK